MTRLDDALALEAVYYSAPIPRDLATLTVLGTVFDKVYFPGVYLPKDGFDEAALDREIERLEALPDARTDYDTALLIGVLKMAKFARTLDRHVPDRRAALEICVLGDEPHPAQVLLEVAL